MSTFPVCNSAGVAFSALDLLRPTSHSRPLYGANDVRIAGVTRIGGRRNTLADASALPNYSQHSRRSLAAHSHRRGRSEHRRG